MYVDITNITPDEEELIQWQYKELGGFKAALWLAIARADTGNLARLAVGFPQEVAAYARFRDEPGYWEDVLVRAKIIPEKEGM